MAMLGNVTQLLMQVVIHRAEGRQCSGEADQLRKGRIIIVGGEGANRVVVVEVHGRAKGCEFLRRLLRLFVLKW